ncbi:MAG: hypothetical protein Q8M39_11280 [Sulfuricurvum sp.]|nr:hypothetical protein [Sulfuricurvum sp.]
MFSFLKKVFSRGKIITVFLKSIKQFYIFEILLFVALLYLLGAFIHMHLNPSMWHLITRTILGIVFLGFIVFVFIIIDLKGGRK